jgi:hypothetical protein
MDLTQSGVIERKDYSSSGEFQSQAVTPVGFTGGMKKTFTDNPTANFYAAKRAGSVILTNANMYSESREGSAGTGTIGPHPVWGRRDVTGNYGALMANTVVTFPEEENAAVVGRMGDSTLIEAYAKMKGHRICSGEAIATLGQTVQMLRRPYQACFEKILRMVRRRNTLLLRHGRTAAQAASSAWLESVYGIMPTLSDAEAIMEMVDVHRARAIESRRLVARSGRTRTHDDGKSFSLSSGSGLPYFDTAVCDATVKFDTVVGAGVIYKVIDRSGSARLSKDLGTRASDIPVTAWNLLPFSFVADWFIDVSTWLQAVVPDPSVQIEGNWVSTVIRKTVSTGSIRLSKYIGNSPSQTYYCTFPENVTSMVWYDRKVNQQLASFPVPQLDTSSVSHAVSGLSLIIANCKEEMRRFRH